jgi:tetratricopeptide (TPR) repeat protein
VPALRLDGLDAASVRALLDENAPVAVADDVIDRLLVETGGNPLALVELPTGLSDAQLAGSVPLPSQLLLTTGVERVFLDRSRRLSAAAQTLMLVAVADDTGELATVRRAAVTLRVPTDALAEAERSGLLVISGDTVSVRHPLVRSAVYQAATADERREVHGALADALDSLADSDRATWHRAAAAEAPDENLVAALAQVGARAEQRGGYRAAAAAHERAADLTADPLAKAALQLAAARNAWASGQTARSSRLLSTARERADDPLLLADIDRLRGRIAVNVGSAADAHRILTQAAERVAVHEPVRALEMAVARSPVAMASTVGQGSVPTPSTSTPRRTTRHARDASNISWSAPGTTSPETVPRHSTSCTPRKRPPSGRPTLWPTWTCSGTSRTLHCTWETTTHTATSTR